MKLWILKLQRSAGGAARAVGAGEFVPYQWGRDDCVVPHKADPTNAPRYAPLSLVEVRETTVPTSYDIVVGNNGARGDVRCSRHGAGDAIGDADDILC